MPTTAPPLAHAAAPLVPTLAPAVIELRQYTLHAGRRDTLIELFEHAFIEPQEAAGMRVLGTFRDLDDADRFVWLRGFVDMASRAPTLAAFYGGPAWQRHRDVANATMVDSDNVLLLRPAGCVRDLLACFVTESAANDFPRLPVREGEPHIAWLTRFADDAAQRRHAALLESSGCLRQPAWRDLLGADPQQLRLAPTRRSALRG